MFIPIPMTAQSPRPFFFFFWVINGQSGVPWPCIIKRKAPKLMKYVSTWKLVHNSKPQIEYLWISASIPDKPHVYRKAEINQRHALSYIICKNNLSHHFMLSHMSKCFPLNQRHPTLLICQQMSTNTTHYVIINNNVTYLN